MATKQTYTNPLDFILGKSEFRIMEVDSETGHIHVHGQTPNNLKCLVELAKNYRYIEHLSEGLFASPDLLESAHFGDSYLRAFPDANLVYWKDRQDAEAIPTISRLKHCITHTYKFGYWPRESEQFSLFSRPDFIDARITSYVDRTISLSVRTRYPSERHSPK